MSHPERQAAVDTQESHLKELAAFLRSRRARLQPEEVGLPRGARRRTAGLRREEVALLADVGASWYTWLEQGRAIRTSSQVLDAVARALRLDPVERAHLFSLARQTDPVAAPTTEVLPDEVRTILDALPSPACALGPRWDILAFNKAEAAVMGDYGALPAHRRNMLWLLFTEPSWRRLLTEWDRDTRRVVAQFRADMADLDKLDHPRWQHLVEALSARSAEFREMWARHEVTGPATRTKVYEHATAGLLSFTATHLALPDHPGIRLIVYTAQDDATETKLGELLARPAFADWDPAVRS
jgi:transcriptional regulator with XRE-family HTH domain